jgi:hypothetical protein
MSAGAPIFNVPLFLKKGKILDGLSEDAATTELRVIPKFKNFDIIFGKF